MMTPSGEKRDPKLYGLMLFWMQMQSKSQSESQLAADEME